MKKIIYVIITILCIMLLAGCRGKSNEPTYSKEWYEAEERIRKENQEVLDAIKEYHGVD